MFFKILMAAAFFAAPAAADSFAACNAGRVAEWQNAAHAQAGPTISVNIDWIDGTSASIVTAVGDSGQLAALYGIKANGKDYCHDGVLASHSGNQIILDLGDRAGHRIILQLGASGKVAGAVHIYGKVFNGETQSQAVRIY